MKRALLLICFAALSACVTARSSPFESRFSRERAGLARFDGPTSEQSCSGTGLSIYLSSQRVRHLDWTIETSTQFIRRQYYFDGSTPGLVIETVHAKFDSRANLLREPRHLSTERIRLDSPQPDKRQKELRDHAKFLIDDFNKHRKEFSRAIDRSA